MMAEATALGLPTLRLTQVSLIARPRPRSVLLCVLAPYLSSTAQPDLRLHSVRGRSLFDTLHWALLLIAAKRQRATVA